MKLIPTCKLRFVLRSNIYPPIRVLQQKWVVDQDAAGVSLTNPAQYDEWRDVPLVELENE